MGAYSLKHPMGGQEPAEMDTTQGVVSKLRQGILIDGEWTRGEAGTLAVLDKYSNELFGEVDIPSAKQIAETVAAAKRAFGGCTLSPYERGAILERAA